ncbi:MAG: glucans biosynthesis glucosyltransferase MdoH, partial [Gammaproteobacteria bacterium]
MNYSRRHRREPRPPPAWRWAARRRRTLFMALTAGQSLLATYYMLAVLPYHGSTLLEIALAVAFALSFAWVSVGAWLAVFGFVYRLFGGDRKSLVAQTTASDLESTPLARTALVMPIYNEPVAQCFAGLASVYRALERSGLLDHFDFFVLSDSRDPDVWLSEQAAWNEWVRKLGAEGRLHYRRRRVNLRYKSGNVADFLRRWGQNYTYFVVLDADSLMGAETLARMVRLMERNPQVGIIQASPRIVLARSLFARVQQFANGLYGPIFGTGLASLQLGDGAYWGHNAIIRTRAFMRHCSLPSLHGIGLFRGPILSHDFAEAAFMRRGGYEVWLEPTLTGSYEQSPPSLVDELARDRRWARGNLQHLPLMLGGRRLGLVQRFIFLNGVVAYAAAPLWLAFLVLSGFEVARFTLWPIDYFPGGHHLFPVWPQWHPEWAILLAASTAFVLLVPKFLAGLDALFRPSLRRGYSGAGRLISGILIESLISVLLAPVRMLAHSRFVVEALIGLRLSWAGQNRGGPIGWWAALLMHGDGLLLGIGWGIF